ncbi:MAG: head fiber protein [Eubacteriales bacterium]|nr:head fiber protein [Eubacteriales bacterium]MDD4105878.1 head fiber protein [Eubacteriales bacterium]
MSNTYSVKNYAAHGGGEWVVGGKLTVLEGAVVTGLTATAAPASAEALGGVKAETKAVTDTVEAKIGEDAKLYVPGYPESYVLPEAAAESFGGVKLAANQLDSTASTIAALNIEFNALLAKLKAAGIMAPDA